MMEGVTRDFYLNKGVAVDEISCNSILREKKRQPGQSGDLCLMQLTMDKHATVFNLQPERSYEVALID